MNHAIEPPSPGPAEDGFTLIELIIVVIVGGLLISALAVGFVVVLRSAGQTGDRLDASHNSLLLASHFPSDVQSAMSVETTGATDCSGRANVLVLRWSAIEFPDAPEYVSTYSVISTDAGEWNLMRSICIDGGSPAEIVVAYNLASAASGSVAITESAGSVSSVGLTVAGAPSRADTSGYLVTVSGTRRGAL